MERRRKTERIETLNSLLNQKVNWKSGGLGLPAETDRGGGGRGEEGGEKSGKTVSETEDGQGQRKCEWCMEKRGRYRERERERESLLPFPGSQVFISLFADAGFITQSSTGAG